MFERSKSTRVLARFHSSESGSMTVFALVIFVLMIMMGGMAVDLMRYEDTRVTLQQTLDRSTLAAASMTQTKDADAVVRDYFAKAGMSEQLDNVTVTKSATYKSVVAKGKVQSPSFFMQLMGINKLDVKAVSGAEQGTSNLEIVLVLDVSGSMSGSKIATLRTSANEFVDTMLDNDPFGRISIAVVPYNAQVNLGSVVRSKFQAVNVHGVANIDCLELPDAAYDTPAVPLTMNLPMMAYADLYGGTTYVNAAVSPTGATALPNFGSSFCRPNQENILRLPSQDKTTIKNRITALTAGGNTSITLGMKWGMTLLDPALRPTFAALGNEGAMSGDLSDRPYDYADTNAQKVIVLMTDGEHVSHDRITDAFKTGPSPIYKATDGTYSVFHAGVAGPNQYWVPHLGTWQATAFGDGAVQQDWKDIWASLKVNYVAWQFYGRALGGNDWNAEVAAFNAARASMVSMWKSVPTMNAMLQTTCNQARDNDVAVYGIAFQAPLNGRTQIQNCATDLTYYYDAGDADKLRAAFRQIATNLTQLRLTQ